MSLEIALSTERRLHDGLVRALTAAPSLSEAEREYRRAWFDMVWIYGESTPFEVAVQAHGRGDHETMDRALSDDRALSALARKARSR